MFLVLFCQNGKMYTDAQTVRHISSHLHLQLKRQKYSNQIYKNITHDSEKQIHINSSPMMQVKICLTVRPGK